MSDAGTLKDLIKEEGKAYARHGITPQRSKPISSCSHSTPSDDAVEGH